MVEEQRKYRGYALRRGSKHVSETIAQTFEEWVKFKDRFDRGLDMFAKLDASHSQTEGSWRKVAVTLAAIEKSLGLDTEARPTHLTDHITQPTKKNAARGMFKVFKKWSMAQYTFTSVKLTQAEVGSLSAATRQLLEECQEGKGTVMVMPSLKYHFPPPPARRGLKTRPMTDDQKAMNVIFVRRVQSGWATATCEMGKMLAAYVHAAEKTYRAKKLKASGQQRVAEKNTRDLAATEVTRDYAGGEERKAEEYGKERDEGKEEFKSVEGKQKEGDSENEKDRRDRASGTDGSYTSDGDESVSTAGGQQGLESSLQSMGCDENEVRERKRRFTDAGLVVLGIRRLSELLGEDEDRLEAKKKDDRLEKEEEARRAHEGWIRVKDTRRFRMPNVERFGSGGGWKPPRFDFSGGKGVVRPKKNLIASTTLDIMRGQGMKYLHAISDARQGVEGDLEKIQRQLKRYNETVVEDRKRRAAARRSQKVKEFRRWARLKETTEEALHCLKNIDPPGEPSSKATRDRWLEKVDLRIVSIPLGSVTADQARFEKGRDAIGVIFWSRTPSPHHRQQMDKPKASSRSSPIRSKNRRPCEERDPSCSTVTVGRALKSVDAHLLAEWTSWTAKSFPVAHCQAVWDALPPKACDTHTTSYSAMRETFLKLLRPCVDYKEAFEKVVRRRLRKTDAARGPGFHDDEKLRDSDLVLNRRELKHLLKNELGIAMTEEEIRRLVDAINTSKEDEVVSWADFESLTGGVRGTRKGDRAVRLERHCVWETTCPVTGMPNAYTVSAVRPGSKAGKGSSGNQESHGGVEQDRGDSRRSGKTTVTTATAWGGTCEIVTLKNGDRRRREGLAERARRVHILSRYGLIRTKDARGYGGAHSGDAGRGAGGPRQQKGGTREEDYDDDVFEGEDSYGEDEFDGSEGEGIEACGLSPRINDHRQDDQDGCRVMCEAAQWPMSKRIQGLEKLKKFSEANREACELRQFLAGGVVPEPPRFWSAKLDHPDMGEERCALTHELLLCWRPQPGIPVAFFSLEMSGPEGSRTFCQGAYREIYRDPPDADGEPEYQFWVQSLSPNTRYGFRVRAFNGFGQGGYSHGCFATRPTEPPAPVAIRTAPTEIWLRWIFDNHKTKVRELRQVFDSLDEYGDGAVGRDELLAFLDSDHPHLLDMLKTCFARGEGDATQVEGSQQREGMNEGCREDGKPEAKAPSVLDAIEANDDEFITWDEIGLHFCHAGLSDAADGGGSRGGRPITARKKRPNNGGHFVLEACVNQKEDHWKEVWKGTEGTAHVKTLEPGRGYRFRLRGVNREGLAGPASASVVVNTLLVTPTAPRIHGALGKPAGGVSVTRVRLVWEPTAGHTCSAASCQTEGPITIGKGGRGVAAADRAATKILQQWANRATDGDGVSLAVVFSRFDQEDDGDMDPLELGKLLEDLGVEVTEERIREAFSELERGGWDGEIRLSLGNLEAWWASDTVTFTILRDNGVDGSTLESRKARRDKMDDSTRPLEERSVTCYRGRETSCDIAGLSPNTLYEFRLRAVDNKTRSSLSAPLEVMTAPRRPEPPVVIRCRRSSIVVKWYPGAGGAYKYHLQSRLVEGLDGASALVDLNRKGGASRSGDQGGTHGSGGGGRGGRRRRRAWGDTGDGTGGWITVYEGVDSTAKVTGLAANSVYRFRVRAANLRSIASEWSAPTQAATAQRKGLGVGDDRPSALIHRPECAEQVFQVNGDDDIVVGDTIIFTERLYVGRDGKVLDGLSSGANVPYSSFSAERSAGAAIAPPAVNLSVATMGSGEADERWWSATHRLESSVARPGLTGQLAVGERTAAAHVLQDSFRIMRQREGSGGLEYNKATSRHRTLRLEIVWSTVSRPEMETLILPPGSVVERQQACLAQFETFRVMWEQEEHRRSVRQEWEALSGKGP